MSITKKHRLHLNPTTRINVCTVSFCQRYVEMYFPLLKVRLGSGTKNTRLGLGKDHVLYQRSWKWPSLLKWCGTVACCLAAVSPRCQDNIPPPPHGDKVSDTYVLEMLMRYETYISVVRRHIQCQHFMYLATGLYACLIFVVALINTILVKICLIKTTFFYFLFLYVLRVCCTPSRFCNCTIYVWHHCELKHEDKTSIFQLFSSF